ncbi:MAG: DUF2460 domain-containing protein [Rhizobiales bacterium]|nr:DUF2460 domain-containing protein [Hyphomicrobiales bacterium]
MAFYESPRFPDAIAYGALGGPEFLTTVVASGSGREARNAAWAYPKHRWDVSQGINGQADFETLRAFFMTMRGRFHAWRFKDWADYTATHTTGVVTGITATTFQLTKRYTSGAQTLDRIITKPVTGTLEVKVSGVVTAHAVDTTTGVVTIGTAPAAANVTWAGEFDVPMRFDTDRLQGRIESRNAQAGLLHLWDSIPIVEVRV